MTQNKNPGVAHCEPLDLSKKKAIVTSPVSTQNPSQSPFHRDRNIFPSFWTVFSHSLCFCSRVSPPVTTTATMNPLFRRSFSIIALVSSKRALTSILQRDSLRVLSSSTPLQHHHHQDTQTSYLQRRFLHSGGFPLGFHFTDRVSAQHAVDEYACDEKKPRKNDENQGLEISALGIADVIVKELAKREITSLFPIQVCKFFFPALCVASLSLGFGVGK